MTETSGFGLASRGSKASSPGQSFGFSPVSHIDYLFVRIHARVCACNWLTRVWFLGCFGLVFVFACLLLTADGLR